MAKATVTVTVDNKVKKGLDPAKKAMLEFQTVVDSVQKKLTKAFSITSIVAVAVKGVNEMTKAAKQCVKEYTEAEKVSKRLEAVWNNVGKTTNKNYAQIMDYSDAIEKTTYFTGEAVEEAALLLAATESLTEEGFQRALDASVDLASALGEDVTSAAQTLSKAIQEPESALSRLKTIGVSFTEEEKEQIEALTDANKLYEAQSLILDKVEQKYKGVAKAINDTPAGLLDNINDTIGDIRENLGGALLNALSPALESIYGWLTKISGWVAEWSAEQNKEQEQLNAWNALNDIVKKGTIDNFSDYNAVANGLPVFNAVWSQKQSEGSTDSESFGDYADILTNMMDEYIGKIDSAIYEVGALGQINTQEQYDLLKDAMSIVPEEADLLKGYLEEWDKVLSPKAQARNKEQARNDVTTFVEDNASLSISKKIADLEESLTNAWNAYSLATSQGMDTEAGYILEVIDHLEDQSKELINIRDGVEEVNHNFLESFTKKIESWINPYGEDGTTYTFFGQDVFSVDKDQANSAANSVVSTLVTNLGEAGSLIGNLAGNMATMGPELGAIVTALNYVIEGLGEVLGDTLNEVAELVIEPFREIGRVVGNVLMPILDAFMPALESVSSFLIDVFDAIGAVLEPIANIIGMALAPVLKVISGVLEFILPFIQAIGNALIVVFSTIEWFMQWVEYLLGSVGNWLANIHVGSWYPFRGFGGNDATRPTDLGTYLQNSFIDMSGDAGNSASTDTAISSASYRGATQVTINIYQMSPVVGENGMRQFAQMIRDEFDALDYYGVSA